MSGFFCFRTLNVYFYKVEKSTQNIFPFVRGDILEAFVFFSK